MLKFVNSPKDGVHISHVPHSYLPSTGMKVCISITMPYIITQFVTLWQEYQAMTHSYYLDQ